MTREEVVEKEAVALREVLEEDLDIFFEQQLDPQANYMAAFTVKDPSDREAYMGGWERKLSDEGIVIRTILFNGQVAGNVSKFPQFGDPAVGYWIGREFWGKGVATRALALFLKIVRERPLYGRAAKDNVGSIRVMQKNGFKIIGEDKGFAGARGEECEEVILRLK